MDGQVSTLLKRMIVERTSQPLFQGKLPFSKNQWTPRPLFRCFFPDLHGYSMYKVHSVRMNPKRPYFSQIRALESDTNAV